MAVTVQQLNQLYLAYFGRPADFNGVQFYTANPNATVASVAAAFSASPESQALYGTTFGAAQVNAIYRVLFNRDAEPAGLAYWSQEVAAGRLTPAMAAYGILVGAQNADATSVANKLTISTAFYNALDTSQEIIGYSGEAAAASARTFLATVTSDAATVTSAQTNLNAQVAASTNAGGGVVIGQTLSLTPGIDTAGTSSAFQSGLSSTFRFTAGNERVDAGIGTLGATDVFLDPSTADQDELVVQLNGASGTFTAQNIENIRANFVAGTPNLQLGNTIGTKVVEVSGGVAGQVSGLTATATSPTVRTNAYTNTLTITPTTLAGTTAAGTAETLNLEVRGATFGTTAATQSAIVIDGTGGAGTLETLNIASGGTAANVFALNTSNGAILGTVNVTGAADANIRVATGDVTGATINGTAHTGVLTLTVDRNGATTATTNLTNVSGVDVFAFRDSTAGGDALVATNLRSGNAVEVQSNFGAGGSLTVFGAATGTADTLTLTLDHATANTGTTVTGLDVQDVETLNFVSNGNSSATVANGNSLTLTGDFTAINVTGDTYVTLAATIDNPASGNRVTTINASGLTGTAAATITATDSGNNGDNRFTITGSANGDTITGGVSNDTIDAGAGVDRIVLSLGTDTVTGGAGVDTFAVSNAVAVSTAAADLTILTDFQTGTATGADRIELLTATVGANTYYEGTAADLTPATDYGVIVLTQAYASVTDAEAAIAAVSTSANPAVVIFLNSSTGFAEAFYDADIDAAGALTDAFLQFQNITTLAGITGFDATNFVTV